MITVAVRGLGRCEELRPAVAALGQRHGGYVQDHYDAVGAALSWPLEQGLGDAFTPEARESWTSTYRTLAELMRAASGSAALGVEAAEQTQVQSHHSQRIRGLSAHAPTQGTHTERTARRPGNGLDVYVLHASKRVVARTFQPKEETYGLQRRRCVDARL